MKRFLVIIVSIYVFACILLICLFPEESEQKIRKVEINDIVFTITNYWPDVDKAVNLLQDYEVDYIITAADGKLVGASNQELCSYYDNDSIDSDDCFEINKNETLQGKIIILDEMPQISKKILIYSFIFITLFFLIDIVIFLYIEKYIVCPAKKISEFARQISKGNLDVPINRVESSYFGLFSQSFDIMREELIYAKKKEWEADKNRREVIASICHDIKNPIASIQAIAEYQFFTTDLKEQKEEFQIIIEKTNQINGQILNLHTSMMNDLERLEVNAVITESFVIKNALQQADYKKKLKNFEIPGCLIIIDQVRFIQIADNIIANSYKYAGTEIEVMAYFENDFLCICIKDFGNGVKKEEEVFLMQKYFRGENAKDKEGSGMGLYMAEYLIKSMGGKMKCYSEKNKWFEVRIWLAIGL